MGENIQKMKGLNSCYVADAAGQQPPLLRVMASVMGYCVILARFYGNAELGSNEPVVLNVCLPSFYTETAGLLIFLRLFQNHPQHRDKKARVPVGLNGMEDIL